MTDDLDKAALDYHRYPKPGKLEISATKNMLNQRVRALASRPVLEGKAVLFKKFADIDVFDLEVDTTDVDEFVNAVALREPTFGGINLEDIRAPECFEIARRLRERMNIPVFHDDQHGTAIVVTAAVRNGLPVADKKPADVKLVCSGAGAAALACLNLLVRLKRDNVTVCDVDSVVYAGREQMDPYKDVFARETDARTLVCGKARGSRSSTRVTTRRWMSTSSSISASGVVAACRRRSHAT